MLYPSKPFDFPVQVALAHELCFSSRLEDQFTLTRIPAWVRIRRLEIAELLIACTIAALTTKGSSYAYHSLPS